MKLKSILEIIGHGVYVRIGTQDGQGWILYDTSQKLYRSKDSFVVSLLEREVINMYPGDYREALPTCCELKAGLAIIIEGFENGKF